jgi:Transcription factor zinc-finger
MMISPVHFPCEAATRPIAHRMGHDLHASNAFSRHKAGGAQCLACHSFLSEPEEGTMQCPVCATGLQIMERQGIEIDYCPQYRGVWLDRGELEKLVE